MGDPCKLRMTQESRFAQAQNQVGLLSNKTMDQKHKTCPQTIKPQWPETHVLPSELSRLMSPQGILSIHTKHINGKVTFQSETPSLY